MPKELVRKRGKRKPKSDPTPAAPVAEAPASAPVLEAIDGRDSGYGQRTARLQQQQDAGGEGDQPSWVTPADGGMGSIRERVEGDAPWGFVDPEVKAYFRTVDEKLKAFEAAGMPEGENAEEENEDRQLLLTAALTELRGKELQLSTDSDCALILERMIWNMGDWGRRVFADSLMGNFVKLIQHRFGSHVVQTLLTLGAKTIDREERGRFPPQQARASSSEGVLPLFSQQLIEIIAELLPALPLLLQSPFSSHPVRVLLLLLSGRPIPAPNSTTTASSSAIRSKRSEKYAKENANFKPIVSNAGEEEGAESLLVSESLKAELKQFWRMVRAEISPVEIRALGVGNVSGPVFQMLIELEAEGGESDEDGSLLDSCLCGLVTTSRSSSKTTFEREDYVEHLLRDQSGSHLLEALLLYSPDRIFGLLWSTYFVGRLNKLSVHPVGNYVVAKGISRLSADQLGELVEKESGDWGRAVKRSRLGVVSAVVKRSSEVGQHGAAVLDAVCAAFEIQRPEQEGYLVPCLLSLKPRRRYRKAAGLPLEEGEEAGSDDEAEPLADVLPAGGEEPSLDDLNRLKRKLGHQRKAEETRDPLAPTVQGCLLAQALLTLSPAEAEVVVSSLLQQNLDDLLVIAHNPVSSRLIDAVLDTPTIPFKTSRKVILAFMDSYFPLVDDRIGSRVGEKIWSKCDGFLKERIAKSLVSFEVALATSQYGRFFSRKLNLNFYKRKPIDWRKAQNQVDAPPVAPALPTVKPVGPTPVASTSTPAPVSTAIADDDVKQTKADKKRKRKAAKEEDELDAIFSLAPTTIATSAPVVSAPVTVDSDGASALSKEERKAAKRLKKAGDAADAGLDSVLDAIRDTVTGEDGGSKKKKSKKTTSE